MAVAVTVIPNHDCTDVRRRGRIACPRQRRIQSTIRDTEDVTQPTTAPRDAATIAGRATSNTIGKVGRAIDNATGNVGCTMYDATNEISGPTDDVRRAGVTSASIATEAAQISMAPKIITFAYLRYAIVMMGDVMPVMGWMGLGCSSERCYGEQYQCDPFHRVSVCLVAGESKCGYNRTNNRTMPHGQVFSAHAGAI